MSKYLLVNLSLNEGQSAPHEKFLPYTYTRKVQLYDLVALQTLYTKVLETITLCTLWTQV